MGSRYCASGAPASAAGSREQTRSLPTLHRMVMELGRRQGPHFRGRKTYEKHIYRLLRDFAVEYTSAVN